MRPEDPTSSPPTFSTASEISRAERCFVPFVSIPAVRPETPPLSAGSARSPARKPASKATTGTERSSRTITRIPFGSTSFTTPAFASFAFAGAVAAAKASRAIRRTSSGSATARCPVGKTIDTVRFSGVRYFRAAAWTSSAVTARILRR